MPLATKKNDLWVQQLKIIKPMLLNIAYREDQSKSAAGIARVFETSRGKVVAWLDGQRPAADDLATMARKLNLSPRWLLLGEGSPDVEQEQPPVCEQPQQAQKPETPLARELREVRLELESAEFTVEEIKTQLAKVIASRTNSSQPYPPRRPRSWGQGGAGAGRYVVQGQATERQGFPDRLIRLRNELPLVASGAFARALTARPSPRKFARKHLHNPVHGQLFLRHTRR